MDPQGHNTRDDVTCEACGEPLALAAEPREHARLCAHGHLVFLTSDKCIHGHRAAEPREDPEMTETPEAQIERLAAFIMAEVPGEPSESEGAVDTAIRIIRRRVLGRAAEPREDR